jgi:hypothetical protein
VFVLYAWGSKAIVTPLIWIILTTVRITARRSALKGKFLHKDGEVFRDLFYGPKHGIDPVDCGQREILRIFFHVAKDDAAGNEVVVRQDYGKNQRDSGQDPKAQSECDSPIACHGRNNPDKRQ